MTKYFLLFILIAMSCATIAQNKIDNVNYGSRTDVKQFYKIISFGDKIDFGNIDASVRWTITNSVEGISEILNGNQINNYSFQQQGEYVVRFSEVKKDAEVCDHAPFEEKMIIKVNPIKLSFDFSKIKFSEVIQRDKSYDDLIIVIPVTITTKDNLITKLTAPGLSIAGIGVSLTAKPLNGEVEVKNGIQLLKYKVSGIVNKETYLMFDFYDFNNQVQTYNLSQIIN